LEHHELYVSSITRVELLAWDEVDAEDELWLQAFLERCELIRVNKGIEDAGAALIRQYGLQLPDALIAATAITEGLWFMSADMGFKRVKKGLKLIHYLA
jgi:predicted nucleic acid-binding protein